MAQTKEATRDKQATGTRHVGVIGLAVMGENLALNIERNGFKPVVYNRTAARTDEFMANGAKGKDIVAEYDVRSFVGALERPRRILMMVKAGAPVDAVIGEVIPYLEAGDILIDGGNSFFHDTERRSKDLEQRGFNYVGMGVSGGEEGALWGPSLMPGGPQEAYDALEPMLTAIAAKSEYGYGRCVTHIGPGGAGHYVKMVHNGIEYGDMQLIAETYDVMRHALGMSATEIADVFGRWTSQNSFELATPTPVIDAAVIARSLSAMKEKRVAASKVLHGPDGHDGQVDATSLIAALEDSLYFAKISSYAQGMALMAEASVAYDWNLNLSEIARIWTGGCIIRAKLLKPIMDVFKDDPDLENMMMAPYFSKAINESMGSVRSVLHETVRAGIPTPATSAALNYVDTYRTEYLPANLIQGLRDFFGAHTYKRLDKPGVFHTEWMEIEARPKTKSEPGGKETWAGGEGEGDRAPAGGSAPRGTGGAILQPDEHQELQQEAEERGERAPETAKRADY